MGMEHMNEKSMLQYQQEERSLISHRVKLAHYRLKEIFSVMAQDHIAPEEKVIALREQLAKYHKMSKFKKMTTMGMLVKEHLHACLFL
jgi:DNA-binding protein H-NS